MPISKKTIAPKGAPAKTVGKAAPKAAAKPEVKAAPKKVMPLVKPSVPVILLIQEAEVGAPTPFVVLHNDGKEVMAMNAKKEIAKLLITTIDKGVVDGMTITWEAK